MQKEKSFILVKWCLAFLIVAGAFVCFKQTSFAMMCPCGNSLNFHKETIPPTCQTDGKENTVCDNCGNVLVTSPGEPASPAYHQGVWTVTQAATETEDGMEEEICELCGEVMDRHPFPATGTNSTPNPTPTPTPDPDPPPVQNPDPTPEPEPAITEETPASTSTAPKKKKKKTETSTEETVSEDDTEALTEKPAEEKNPWEGEEVYIDPETKKKVFEITGGVVAGAVLIGIIRAIVLSAKAKKARAAAKAAEKVLKEVTEETAETAESEFEKPEIEFEIKTVLACLTDTEDNKKFTKFLSRKKYIKLETADAEERENLAESLDDYEAELFIFDVASQEDVDAINELIDGIKEEDKYKRFSILVKASEYKNLKPSLDKMKLARKIEGFAADNASADSKLVNLVLPVYKPNFDGDSVLGYMASVADALGIPYVSEVIEYFSTGKEIVETLKSDELETMDKVDLIGNIASILGIDKVVEVTDFLDKVSEAKEIICGNETEEVEEIENS